MPTVSIPAMLLMLALFVVVVAAWTGVVLRLAFGLPILPPRTPRVVPWGVGSVLLAILGWLALQIFVPTLYILVAYPRQPGVAAVARPDLGPAEQMALSALINACSLLLIPLGLALTSGARPRDFGLVSEGFARQVFRGMVAYPLLVPIVFGAMIGALAIWKKTPHPLEDALKLGVNPTMLVIQVLAAVVFAPLAEELIFRGVLLGWLTRMVLGRPMREVRLVEEPGEPDPSTLVLSPEVDPGFAEGLDRDPSNPYAAPSAKLETIEQIETTENSDPATPWKTLGLILANVAVSIVFAGLHWPVWPTPIPIFFLSLGLGMLYQRTGSLIPSMVLHMTFNGVSTLLMLLALAGGTTPPEVTPPPAAPKVPAKPAALIPVLNFFHDRTD